MMSELTVQAASHNLQAVRQFILDAPSVSGMSEVVRYNAMLVLEEIFINIADYAYGAQTGQVTIGLCVKDGKELQLSFSDEGVAFDPLAKAAPDIGQSAGQREPGGLGIYIVRQIASEISYQRKNERNVLTVVLREPLRKVPCG